MAWNTLVGSSGRGMAEWADFIVPSFRNWNIWRQEIWCMGILELMRGAELHQPPGADQIAWLAEAGIGFRPLVSRLRRHRQPHDTHHHDQSRESRQPHRRPPCSGRSVSGSWAIRL